MLAEIIDLFWTQRSSFEVRFVGFSVLLFVSGLLIWTNIRKRTHALGSREVLTIGLLWTLLCTVQYWILGSHSILGHSDEQSAGVPWIYYLTRVHDGGLFSHAWSGGSDTTAAVVFGTEHVSVEWILFSLFPPWIALLLMKAGTIAIAFAGGYVVARRGVKLAPEKAVVLGMLAGVGNILNIGWAVCANGWGFALLPWMFYVLCMTTEAPLYYLRVAGLAFLFSASSSIFHQLPLSYVAVGLGFFLFPPKYPKRFVLGCVLFGLICVLNWFEVLNTIIQLGPESARSTTVPVLPYSPFFMIIYKIRAIFDFMVVPVGFFALAVLAIKRDPIFPKALIAYIVAVGIGAALTTINWSATGISFLAAYRWQLFSYGDSFVILLIAALALRNLDWSPKRLGRMTIPAASAILLASIAIAAAADHKANDIERYRSLGGQGHFMKVSILTDKSWHPKEPFRVVTMSQALSPNMANAYGFDSYDGVSNSFPKRSDFFYGLAVQRPPRILTNKSYHWLTLPAGTTSLSTSVNTDALRIANVRYVISDRKLEDPNITRVISSKPDDFSPHHVHELKAPWPRVFIPEEVRVSGLKIDDKDFYDELLKNEKYIALIGADDAPSVRAEEIRPASYSLKGFQVVRDGFDIEVESRMGAEKAVGVVVVNVPYTRFWMASSQGRSLQVFPVNGVHMAIVVDGAGSIIVRYKRPTVF